ncbi:MAG: SGNH/GDSL hydrolase family protein [Firmicutes bacterium]|nr:SGNH/GDSL hydrolase family protein [Bacillota bacterium]
MLNKKDFITDNIKERDWQIIPADSPDLYYIGRIDDLDPKAPVLVWQGTEVRARFTGKNIGLRFSEVLGQNFYNVIIDGQIKLLKLKEAKEINDYLLADTLPDGTHDLILFKRSEAMSGHAVFQGLFLEKSAQLGPKPEPLPLRIEFYGDSITAGACNEDPWDDQYEDCSTHNNYLSYAAITARNFNAEYFNIAVSGTGLCHSWNPIMMPEIYDKIYPDSTSPKYGFSGKKPEIVLINLGQNDQSYPVSINKPFPRNYAEKYVEFVSKIRSLYPESHIVCAIGGMDCYHASAEFRAAFQQAVQKLKNTDPKIHSFVFEAYTLTHPRVDTHLKLASELTAFLKTILV